MQTITDNYFLVNRIYIYSKNGVKQKTLNIKIKMQILRNYLINNLPKLQSFYELHDFWLIQVKNKNLKFIKLIYIYFLLYLKLSK